MSNPLPDEERWAAFDAALRDLEATLPPPDLRACCLPPAHSVLVVDDEPNIRRLVQVHLEAAGYRVTTAADGRAALEQFGRVRPDLVLLDVMMPEMDGLEVLRHLKAHPESAGVPVVLLTARSGNDDIRRGWQQGTDFYLPKPFNPAELRELVRQLLATAGSPDEPPPLRRWPK